MLETEPVTICMKSIWSTTEQHFFSNAFYMATSKAGQEAAVVVMVGNPAVSALCTLSSGSMEICVVRRNKQAKRRQSGGILVHWSFADAVSQGYCGAWNRSSSILGDLWPTSQRLGQEEEAITYSGPLLSGWETSPDTIGLYFWVDSVHLDSTMACHDDKLAESFVAWLTNRSIKEKNQEQKKWA